MQNQEILERLSIGEVRIRRAMRALDVVSRLARQHAPLTPSDVGTPLDDTIAHLLAATQTLTDLRRSLTSPGDVTTPERSRP